MREKIGAAIAVMVLIFSTAGLAEPSDQEPLFGTQNQMLINCSSFRGDAGPAGSTVMIPDRFTAGICWGAFLFMSGSIQIKNEQGQSVLAICTQELLSTNQLISKFLMFADQHPELGDKSFVYSAVMALAQAFPCAGTKVTVGKRR